MSHSTSSRTLLYQSVASLTGLILLLIWIEGGFSSKTPPGLVQAAEQPPLKGRGVPVEVREISEIRAWPATVAARAVAQISTKIPARILALNAKVGDTVKRGQILVQLDGSESRARLNQAKSALAAAEAQSVRASTDARRTQNLFNQDAATQQQLDAALAQTRSASAQVAEAQSAIRAAESIDGEAELRAPFDGAIIQRLMDPGDMAMPGQPALTLQTEKSLRIESNIPESCAGHLTVGQDLTIRIDAERVSARLAEIAPASDPTTRTVLIKADLEPSAIAQPGTFVWLEQACGTHSGLWIPAAAVNRTGQLESVHVLVGGTSSLRHIRTGKTSEDSIEVLSGLKAGELVLIGGQP